MKTYICIKSGIFLACLVVVGTAGSGIGRAQDNVGPNEQRFNAGVYTFPAGARFERPVILNAEGGTVRVSS